MSYFLFLALFLFIGYILMVQRARAHSSPLDMIQQGVTVPLQVLQDAASSLSPSLPRLSDWIPFPQRRYAPNPYGYGGLDPEGGERKGGNGLGIPHAVDVGWWKGEDVTYPERKLFPVQDEKQAPTQPQVADVGWWGDDWLA